MPAADITFLYGEHLSACTHDIDKVWEGYFTFQVMTAGTVDLTIGTTRFALAAPPVQVWSAYPGPRIAFHAEPPGGTWTHRYIAFRGLLVERWMNEAIYPVAPQPAGDVPELAARFDRMLELSRHHEARSQLRAAHLLEGMLLDIADRRQAPADAVVTAAQARLESLLTSASPPDYARLAEDLGVSESTLRRRFVRAIGMGPHEYLLQARVAEARRLLGESDLPIKTVADRLGYRDVYFFSRQFRQITGVPPATYRRSRLG